MSHDTMATSLSHLGEACQAKLAEHSQVNVGETERVVSVMGGGVLALYGLARGGLMGMGLMLAGGALAYRGISGHCEAYHALGMDTCDTRQSHRKTA